MLVDMNTIWSSLVDFFNDYILFPIKENFDLKENTDFINIIDILLLAGLLYVLYKFIRDRHASRILIGFGLLMILYVASDIFNMIALNSVLQTFYAVGIIALCVIFQPELRGMLEEFGTTTSANIKRIANRQTITDDMMLTAVEEISAAAFELSSKGEGALIVLERAGRLRNQMTEGTPIDAVVTRQLLCNICVNKSPLHDGAVVVRGNKIVAAGCFLPLTQRNVNKEMGTRHRAAIGITEETNVLSIVVSEETGIISVVRKGEIKRYMTMDKLKDEIEDAFGISMAALARREEKREKKHHGRFE